MKFIYEGVEIDHSTAVDNPQLKDHVSFWIVVLSAVMRKLKYFRYVQNDKLLNDLAKGIAQITYDNPQLCEWLVGKDWKETHEA